MFFEKILFLVIDKLVLDGDLLKGFDIVYRLTMLSHIRMQFFYKYVVNFCKAKNVRWDLSGLRYQI